MPTFFKKQFASNAKFQQIRRIFFLFFTVLFFLALITLLIMAYAFDQKKLFNVYETSEEVGVYTAPTVENNVVAAGDPRCLSNSYCRNETETQMFNSLCVYDEKYHGVGRIELRNPQTQSVIACTVFVIHSYWAMTSAHCILSEQNFTSYPKNLSARVFFGCSNLCDAYCWSTDVNLAFVNTEQYTGLFGMGDSEIAKDYALAHFSQPVPASIKALQIAPDNPAFSNISFWTVVFAVTTSCCMRNKNPTVF